MFDAEIFAAQKAGMLTCVACRPGNAPIDDRDLREVVAITTFSELPLVNNATQGISVKDPHLYYALQWIFEACVSLLTFE